MSFGPLATGFAALWVVAQPTATYLDGLRVPGPVVRDEVEPVRWTAGRLRVAAGSEWDTNARRAIQGEAVEGTVVAFPNANRPFEVVSDGLVRVVLDAAGGVRFGDRHGLRGHYVLGAKRFVEETTEDLLVQEIGITSMHQLTDPVRLSIDGTYKGSRVRSGLRDYDVITAGSGLTVRLSDALQADLQLRVTRFMFAVEPRFDYWGPRASVGLVYRPVTKFTVSLRGGGVGRFYDGRALVEGVLIDTSQPEDQNDRILTFCENPEAEREAGYECTPAGKRQDFEILGSLSFSYRGPFLLGAQYLLRLQRSNSDFENIDRHRIELTATFGLPGKITVNILGALQLNQGVSITDQKFLADADENQNSVNVGIQRPIAPHLYLEGRYALFTNQFSTAQVSFVRHTVYVGLGYRADLLDSTRSSSDTSF